MSLAWNAAAGFRRAIAVVIMLGFVVALLESVTLLALFSFVARLASSGASTGGTPVAPLAGLFNSLSPVAQGGMILGAATVRFLLTLVLEAKMSALWVAIRASMQRSMMEVHLNAVYPYLTSRKAGEHNYQIIEGPSFAAVYYLHLARYVATSALLLILFLTLLYVSPYLMLITAVVALVYGAAVRRVSVKVSYAAGQRQAAAISRQGELVNEGLAGIRYLRTLGAVPAWLSAFSAESHEAERAMGRAGFWSTVPARTLEYLILVAFLAAALFVLLGSKDLMTVLPTMAVFFLGIVRILPALAVLGSGRMLMMQALPNLEKFVQLRDSIAREPLNAGSRSIPSLQDHPILFSDVEFSYAGNHVLKKLTCQLQPGSITALVGRSGQGKSTLIDLLLRFVEPSSGRILVDGEAIGAFALDEWRKRISYVGQDPFLFHSSILENIRLGRPDASQAAVAGAAEIVGATEFILQQPQGWNTVLADRGMSLSGGQRQRIVLARALLTDAQLLILDEPTSALDAGSESRVLSEVLANRRGRTTLLVTHSREAARMADRILVLEQGEITESGSYVELEGKDSLFRQIFSGNAARE
jgi:ABC-type multidrug transport system fused ATPase/permease subunit